MSNVYRLSTGVAAEIKIARIGATSFDEWWAIYPRKVAKKHAQGAWRKLRADERQAAMDALPAHVAHWRERYGDDRTFIPHPATWLNGGRWEDELDPIVEPKPASRPVAEAWWATDASMERKGIEVGVGRAQPGWSRFEYKARIEAAINQRVGRVA